MKVFKKIFFPIITTIIFFIAYLLFHTITLPHTEVIQNILLSISIISIAWLIDKIILFLIDRNMQHHHFEKKNNNLEERKIHTKVNYIKAMISIAIFLVAIGIALGLFDGLRQVGNSVLASAGILGIIIGFAAQKLIANILAGFQIAFTQPIRIDDVVIVENEWGRIEEITLTYVVVRIWDQRRLVLPITYFTDKPFQNWTRTNAEIMGTVFLYTDYKIPIEKVREELQNIVAKTPLWDKRVAGLQVTNSTERSIELRVLLSAKNASDAWDLRCHVREKLISFIKNNYPESLPRSRIVLDRLNDN